MKIEVTSQALERIERAAQAAHPREACGLLLGALESGVAKIDEAVQTRNVHSTPDTHFEIDPRALIDAHRAEREGGPHVLGYFHTHPEGPPAPSSVDQAQAAGDGKIWAIAGAGEVRFFLDTREGFEPLRHNQSEG
ncbi:MAG: M67 family metallopeptidase [Pseudomonadota bacterium]